MRGSEFVYDSVHVLYYNLNKLSLGRGGSYIDSPKWLKSKKATINPKNKDLTVALNYVQIKNHPERISNNKSIALNILYVPHNTETIRYAYKSKYNLTR